MIETSIVNNAINFFSEYEQLFVWMGLISLAMFILSALLLPWVLAYIPEDYFSAPAKPESWLLMVQPANILRNLLGLVVLLLGILMLVLPGQGILTILLGLGIMQFPGKYRLERKIIASPKVLKGVNWIREKTNKPPLKF